MKFIESSFYGTKLVNQRPRIKIKETFAKISIFFDFTDILHCTVL